MLTPHQKKQIEVIDLIEQQIKNNQTNFSVVSPVENFENDTRMCLTSVHIPKIELKEKIEKEIIQPLREISPEHFYYPFDSLHMTIKSIKTINDPPHFTEENVLKITKLYDEIIKEHKKFNVYFYRLLLFPLNLALIGTTDEEFDDLISELDSGLKTIEVPDDKTYANDKYFFCNITLSRFNTKLSESFKTKVEELSKKISFEPYEIDSVTLTINNGVFMKRRTIKTWKLG